jgi:hypothetical protein
VRLALAGDGGSTGGERQNGQANFTSYSNAAKTAKTAGTV